ncbi:hypothetical protein C8Q80DRAFT_879994 [Daedaleopsis nitida]|nr:hypothetical protein C8Q80DRAFT_879994 [Daedaleopsis nitida]
MSQHDTPHALSFADADIILRSSDGSTFRVHKLVLKIASAGFAGMFTLPDATTGALPVVDLTEDAASLEKLLRRCYPVARPPLTTLADILTVLAAAEKYCMGHVVSMLEPDLFGLLRSGGLAPLRAYALAFLHKLPQLAREAARLLIRDPNYLHHPYNMPAELKDIPASAVYALTTYHTQCVAAAHWAVDDRQWMLRLCDYDSIDIEKSTSGPSSLWAWLQCPESNSTPAHPMRTDLSYIPDVSGLREWWYTYNRRAKMRLDAAPIGDAVTSPSLIHSVVSDVGVASCTSCSSLAWRDLAAYSRALAKKIDEDVSKVELWLPF